MKIILKKEVDNLGLAGDVVDVADGFGRNYLIPRGLAIKATEGALKEADNLTRARKAHESKTMGTAEEFKRTLEGRSLRIPVRVDERGHLYGSVGPGEVQEVLKERGHEIERRRIHLDHNIKEIGSYKVEVRLHPQVSAAVPIDVVDVEGEVTLESLEQQRREERAVESIEDAALAAAEELENEELAEALEEEQAEGDTAETEADAAVEAQGVTETAGAPEAASGATTAEEALLAQASDPSDVQEVRIADDEDTEDDEA